jgi:hypothetical protein
MNKSILNVVGVVAVVFSVGCSDPDGGGDGSGTDGTNINPGDSLPIVDPNTNPDWTREDSLEQAKEDARIEAAMAKFKRYMGDVLIVGWAKGATTPTDTIGWAKVYTRNGWGRDVEVLIELPNGFRSIANGDQRLTTGGTRISIYEDILGYGDGISSVQGVWREPNLGK